MPGVTDTQPAAEVNTEAWTDNTEQSSEQATEDNTEQSSVQAAEDNTEQSSVQASVVEGASAEGVQSEPLLTFNKFLRWVSFAKGIIPESYNYLKPELEKR